MPKFEGQCAECGALHHSDRKDDTAICDCWRRCPLCGEEMQPYTPDLTPNSYGRDGKREFTVLMVCQRHSPPFYSTKKPVEVVCT
ncbi:MAG TPA: hypothetical protein VIH48_01550 [Candidatus Bathyarchaeia archaeon]